MQSKTSIKNTDYKRGTLSDASNIIFCQYNLSHYLFLNSKTCGSRWTAVRTTTTPSKGKPDSTYWSSNVSNITEVLTGWQK